MVVGVYHIRTGDMPLLKVYFFLALSFFIIVIFKV